MQKLLRNKSNIKNDRPRSSEALLALIEVGTAVEASQSVYFDSRLNNDHSFVDNYYNANREAINSAEIFRL